MSGATKHMTFWIAADKNGSVYIYRHKPIRSNSVFQNDSRNAGTGSIANNMMLIPHSVAMRIVGKPISWDEEPIEVTG